MNRKVCYCLTIFIGILTACSPTKQSHLNEKASVHRSDKLPENPLLWTPLTSSINTQQQTMSTLYGNTIAAHYADQFEDDQYPKGAILYEVTWQQRKDERWFGANIPGQLLQMERVAFTEKNSPSYTQYTGTPITKNTDINIDIPKRIKRILSQSIANSPKGIPMEK